VLGAILHAGWHRKNEQSKRRIPRKWPLTSRALVNSKERHVWRWLIRTFHDHQVLVKVPVTRFTMLQDKGESQPQFQILNGVYCTFTICSNLGRVIGCVDVPSHLGFSLSNQSLKQRLLSQCELHYLVVDPDSLPTPDSIRATLLGTQVLSANEGDDRSGTGSEFNESRGQQKASLLRQQHHKSSDMPSFAAESRFHDTSNHDAYESQLSTSWEHDSFVSPQDSRYIDQS
jgi:hypothetical protein